MKELLDSAKRLRKEQEEEMQLSEKFREQKEALESAENQLLVSQ